MRHKTTGDAASAPLSEEEIKARLKADAALVHERLGSALRQKGVPPGLAQAMEYSLLAGGKRIRPVLCLTSARLFGLDASRALPFACAIECIHTSSLIHDDLPAMDNDDLRRGRPSSHKAFDEATAILAGDGLVTDAFGLMASCLDCGLPAERVLEAVALAARCAGSPGMVGGQYLDMRLTGQKGVSLDELRSMQAMKTGAMLRLACEAGAVLAGADEKGREAMRAYGRAFGRAFQITDDILDETGSEDELGKPVGSDAEQDKNTYPSLIGLEASREAAFAASREAIDALRGLGGPDAAMLRGLAALMANRIR
jgi:geranylgeranyl diphosphate synthase type II